MNLLSRHEVDRIETTLASLLPDAPHLPDLALFHEAVRAFVMSGGKRVRPQLCVWTCKHAGGDVESAALYQLACGWELFHAFLLVHDDLIDDADTRRDEPSLHRNLQRLYEACGEGAASPEKAGRDLATVAGDLLFAAAGRAFHDVELPPTVYREQLRLFSRVTLTTGLGQALDICQSHRPLDSVCESTLLREYHWKTAAYTFEGPMLSGAILAGASDAAVESISKYALALGQAYQLHNDLLDLATPAHEGCDLVQGKRTVTLVRARSAMKGTQLRRVDKLLAEIPSSNGQSVELAEELRQEILRSSAVGQTRRMIDGFLAEARGEASGGPVGKALGGAMNHLLDSLESGYFAEPRL